MSTKHGYMVEVLDFEEIHSLPGTWTDRRYREILEALDFDDAESIPESDLADMAAMAAQDTGQREASDQVLAFVFGERMSVGVRQNLIDDLTDDRPWEQFADLDRQAGIFEAVELLQRAFPSAFGIPDAARARVRLTANGKHESGWLQEGPAPSLLVRLLADAMDRSAVLVRLYADQLAGAPFPEANSLVWSAPKQQESQSDNAYSCEIDVYSSLQWFGPLRDSEGAHFSEAEPDPGD